MRTVGLLMKQDHSSRVAFTKSFLRKWRRSGDSKSGKNPLSGDRSGEFIGRVFRGSDKPDRSNFVCVAECLFAAVAEYIKRSHKASFSDTTCKQFRVRGP
jgi:hypothetical protein